MSQKQQQLPSGRRPLEPLAEVKLVGADEIIDHGSATDEDGDREEEELALNSNRLPNGSMGAVAGNNPTSLYRYATTFPATATVRLSGVLNAKEEEEEEPEEWEEASNDDEEEEDESDNGKSIEEGKKKVVKLRKKPPYGHFESKPKYPETDEESLERFYADVCDLNVPVSTLRKTYSWYHGNAMMRHLREAARSVDTFEPAFKANDWARVVYLLDLCLPREALLDTVVSHAGAMPVDVFAHCVFAMCGGRFECKYCVDEANAGAHPERRECKHFEWWGGGPFDAALEERDSIYRNCTDDCIKLHLNSLALVHREKPVEQFGIKVQILLSAAQVASDGILWAMGLVADPVPYSASSSSSLSSANLNPKSAAQNNEVPH